MKAHFKYYIAIFITLTVGLFNFNKASATEKVDALWEQSDQAQPIRQRATAKNLFRQVEKEDFLDEPFSIPAHWPADSIRAEVWSTAGQYYFYDQDFKRSIYYSNLALQILQGSHDTEREAECICNLSEAYNRIYDYARSLRYDK